jgi:hypothetical protein
LRPGAIKSGWRAIVGVSVLQFSGNGPYAKAVHAAHSKFMSSDFDKMVADPRVIADVVVDDILKSQNPKAVYTAPRMARNLSLVHGLLGSDRLRDAFTRKFIGLPKRCKRSAPLALVTRIRSRHHGLASNGRKKTLERRLLREARRFQFGLRSADQQGVVTRAKPQIGVQMRKAEKKVAKAVAVPRRSAITRHVFLKRGMHR